MRCGTSAGEPSDASRPTSTMPLVCDSVTNTPRMSASRSICVPPGAPMNRLGLAQWIVDRENPLTARVAVNRLWQQCFGEGLVRTVNDFGAQGELPTHPELLDYLAVRFMDQGWSVKKLIREIVLSNTYRQSSHVSPDLVKRDPENMLLDQADREVMERQLEHTRRP